MRSKLNALLWLLVLLWFGYTVWVSTNEQGHPWLSADAGFQWMMGHAFVQGETAQLYTVSAGERWLQEGYAGNDLEQMTQKLFRKGKEKKAVRDNIDGPLYPPTACFVFSWQGCFAPRTAHTLAVLLQLLFTVLTACLIPGITGSRIRAGEAALFLCLFPHHFPGMMLGQYHPFSLLLFTAGWWCLTRQCPWLAGVVWGLFIYKPVVLLALLLVPLSLLNWRLLAGMIISSLVLILATLPFTQGIEPWKRWLTVGQRASAIYELDRRWIWMSRDLSGLPRRAMWRPAELATQVKYCVDADVTSPDFTAVNLETTATGRVQSPRWVSFVGWGLLGFVGLTTLWVMWRQEEEIPLDGVAVAFLLLGVCFSIFHFMHYDLILMALPMLLLVSQWKQLAPPMKWMLGMVLGVLLLVTINFHRVSHYSLLTIPWETLALLILWLFLAIVLAFPWLSSRFCYLATPTSTLPSAG